MQLINAINIAPFFFHRLCFSNKISLDKKTFLLRLTLSKRTLSQWWHL